jgi:uncharacterized protein
VKRLIKYISILMLLLGLSLSATAQNDIPELPRSKQAVNDFTNTLGRSQINMLEQKLASFTNRTSSAIVIAMVPTLNGYDVVEYTERLAEKWQIGQEGKDNGIMIVIRPKTRSQNGRVHIAVGYGLEGVVPDAIAKRIIENEMIPYFKQGDYAQALYKSTDVLISLTEGEFTAEEYNQRTKSSGFGFLVPLFAIVFFLIVSRASGRGGRTYGSSSLPIWALLFMGGGMGRGSHHGSWNNFSGGSGGFGGGGSSFGGFGGGSFGGGGASGSW